MHSGAAGRPSKDRATRVISMRLIASAATAGLVAVAVLASGFVAERHARTSLTTEVESRLLLEARNLALTSADALLAEYPELTLFPIVKEMQAGRKDLAFVVVLDREGSIQGDVDAQRLGEPCNELAALRPVSARWPLAPGEQLRGDGTTLAAVVPVKLADGRPLGTAAVGLRRAYLETEVTRARNSLLGTTIALVLFGGAAALALMSHLLKPIGDLRAGLVRIGQGDLDTPLRLRDHTEIGLLANAVNGMAAQLKVSQEQLVEKERLAHEMNLARSIQESLMPKEEMAAGDFVVRGVYEAAAEVGGDYWDLFRRSDGKIGVVIADVAGKGLGGCLVTSMLAVLLRSLREEIDSPARLLAALEARLAPSLRPGVFVTIFYGLLEPETGRFVFASAAHSPLLVCRGVTKQVEWHRTRGIPLGVVRRGGVFAASLSDQVVDLGPLDLAMQCTDGLNEAFDAEGREEFGFDRVAESVRRAAPQGAASVLAALQRGLREWTGGKPPGDDLTLLVVARSGARDEVRENAAPTEDGVAVWQQLESEFRGAAQVSLPIDLAQLTRLRPWLDDLPGLAELPAEARQLAETCLYELCANIIEHGYGGQGDGSIEIRWQPAPAAIGGFLVRDHGRVYDMAGWRPADLTDPVMRRRGRGLGLQIVRAALQNIRYLPGTPAGNLTLLRFESSDRQLAEGVRHA